MDTNQANPMTEQELWHEADEAMAKYKAENPDIDWNVYETFAVMNNQTMQIMRVGHAKKSTLDNINGTPRS